MLDFHRPCQHVRTLLRFLAGAMSVWVPSGYTISYLCCSWQKCLCHRLTWTELQIPTETVDHVNSSAAVTNHSISMVQPWTAEWHGLLCGCHTGDDWLAVFHWKGGSVCRCVPHSPWRWWGADRSPSRLAVWSPTEPDRPGTRCSCCSWFTYRQKKQLQDWCQETVDISVLLGTPTNWTQHRNKSVNSPAFI